MMTVFQLWLFFFINFLFYNKVGLAPLSSNDRLSLLLRSPRNIEKSWEWFENVIRKRSIQSCGPTLPPILQDVTEDPLEYATYFYNDRKLLDDDGSRTKVGWLCQSEPAPSASPECITTEPPPEACTTTEAPELCTTTEACTTTTTTEIITTTEPCKTTTEPCGTTELCPEPAHPFCKKWKRPHYFRKEPQRLNEFGLLAHHVVRVTDRTEDLASNDIDIASSAEDEGRVLIRVKRRLLSDDYYGDDDSPGKDEYEYYDQGDYSRSARSLKTFVMNALGLNKNKDPKEGEDHTESHDAVEKGATEKIEKKDNSEKNISIETVTMEDTAVTAVKRAGSERQVSPKSYSLKIGYINHNDPDKGKTKISDKISMGENRVEVKADLFTKAPEVKDATERALKDPGEKKELAEVKNNPNSVNLPHADEAKSKETDQTPQSKEAHDFGKNIVNEINSWMVNAKIEDPKDSWTAKPEGLKVAAEAVTDAPEPAKSEDKGKLQGKGNEGGKEQEVKNWVKTVKDEDEKDYAGRQLDNKPGNSKTDDTSDTEVGLISGVVSDFKQANHDQQDPLLYAVTQNSRVEEAIIRPFLTNTIQKTEKDAGRGRRGTEERVRLLQLGRRWRLEDVNKASADPQKPVDEVEDNRETIKKLTQEEMTPAETADEKKDANEVEEHRRRRLIPRRRRNHLRKNYRERSRTGRKTRKWADDAVNADQFYYDEEYDYRDFQDTPQNDDYNHHYRRIWRHHPPEHHKHFSDHDHREDHKHCHDCGHHKELPHHSFLFGHEVAPPVTTTLAPDTTTFIAKTEPPTSLEHYHDGFWSSHGHDEHDDDDRGHDDDDHDHHDEDDHELHHLTEPQTQPPQAQPPQAQPQPQQEGETLLDATILVGKNMPKFLEKMIEPGTKKIKLTEGEGDPKMKISWAENG